MAFPSPVHVCAEVAEKYARPYPPVARTVLWERNRWIVPSSMHSAITPTHSPSCMMRSSAKYSTKNCVSWRKAWPYRVWSIACPVRSAAHAHRYAWPPLPKSRLCPPNARW